MPLATYHDTRIPSGIVPLCVPGDAPLPLPLLETTRCRQAPSGTESDPQELVGQSWRIYVITNLADGRVYVGLTRRALLARMRSHVAQANRDRRIRAGGLMEAIQQAFARGQTFAEAFSVRVVAMARTKVQAVAMERAWVARLGSRKPHGFNDMPGGSSAGGTDNAQPLTVKLADGGSRRFASIGDAVDWSNARLQAQGCQLLDAGTVYARLAMQWSPEEALGVVPHTDGRSARESFIMNGTEYRTLAEAAAVSGISIDTLRSRLHRQRVSGTCTDLAIDRRKLSGPRGCRSPRVAATEPRTPTDRRKLVVLVLPDGTRLEGGERELIGKVLADFSVEPYRTTRLSMSGVRRRLRLLADHDRLSGGDAVLWAFGFTDTAPANLQAPAQLH